jgi:hypothetical protein
VSNNFYERGLNQILNVVEACVHTNISLECPSYTDLMKSSCVNKELTRFNRKPTKCIKLYEHCTIVNVGFSRGRFTNHGLHLNG